MSVTRHPLLHVIQQVLPWNSLTLPNECQTNELCCFPFSITTPNEFTWEHTHRPGVTWRQQQQHPWVHLQYCYARRILFFPSHIIRGTMPTLARHLVNADRTSVSIYVSALHALFFSVTISSLCCSPVLIISHINIHQLIKSITSLDFSKWLTSFYHSQRERERSQVQPLTMPTWYCLTHKFV